MTILLLADGIGKWNLQFSRSTIYDQFYHIDLMVDEKHNNEKKQMKNNKKKMKLVSYIKIS